ncbi:hypothetical protein D3C73_463340 [compost metagenome]
MMEVGVASPMAHGQAMISTATALTRAMPKDAPCAGSGPNRNHTAKVRTAMTMTAGTNQPVTRSTRAWIGSLAPCAVSTMRTIWASTVWAPTWRASKRKAPVVFSVPPVTSAPAVFSTGIGSPVSMDSSTKEPPSATTPSTGTRSPGRTTTKSPTCTASMGRSCSAPSRTTRAVLACSDIRRRMA